MVNKKKIMGKNHRACTFGACQNIHHFVFDEDTRYPKKICITCFYSILKHAERFKEENKRDIERSELTISLKQNKKRNRL